MNETKFTKELRNSIKLKWPHSATFKISGTAMGAGLPDVVAVIEGRTVFIECKVTGSERVKPFNPLAGLTERQSAIIQQIIKAGAPVFVATRYTKLNAVFVKMNNISYPIVADEIMVYPIIKTGTVGQTRMYDSSWMQTSQRHSGGVWDNLEFFVE